MLKKSYLIEYNESQDVYHALNSLEITAYELKIKTVWLGIFKTFKTIRMPITIYQNLEATLNKFDDLIANKKALN